MKKIFNTFFSQTCNLNKIMVLLIAFSLVKTSWGRVVNYLLIFGFLLFVLPANSQVSKMDTLQPVKVQQSERTVILDRQTKKIVTIDKIEESKTLKHVETSSRTENEDANKTKIISDTTPKQKRPTIINPRDFKGLTLAYDGGSSPKNTTAAPANDAICNATTLPVKGAHLTNQTNLHSTADYYGGCIPSGAISVFYKFTITGSNNMMTITMDNFADLGRQVYFFLMNGTCTSPNGIQTESSKSSNPLTQTFYGLSAGTYYVMIASQTGVGNELSSFRISGTQSVAPKLTSGPEQDCAGAIPVCDVTYVQSLSYTGYGDYQEINYGSTCLTGGETNSVWYIFTPQTSGNLAFTINTTKDYDWALYNLTAIGGCSNIPGATPVLCNYSGTYGLTGTTLPIDATIPRSIGAAGLATMPGISVTAGTSYVLIVNNYSADASGYDLTFNVTSGTASIVDNPPLYGEYPSMVSASSSCADNSITLNISENIRCTSISTSNFTLTNTTTSQNFTSAITQITGVGCATGDLTNQLTISHNGTLTTGVYQLTVNSGATLSDKCGNPIQAGGFVNFNYLAPLTLTATPSTICFGQPVSLDANGADGTPSVTSYTLNPGGLTNNTNGVFSGISPSISTNYTVSATYGGCTRTANAMVTVEGNIITTIFPANKTVCSFPTTITASTTVNGVANASCTYLWSNGGTTASIVINAPGTYTVTATTTNGCVNSNSPSSIISYAGSGTGGGTCDVLYVSPAGGGTGLTKTSPTTLADAVTKAMCTSTIIKMQKGIYTLTNYQFIPSYITIEGGYDALFTIKSSDMTGGTNSTTIRRTNAPDAASPTTCTAFRVDDSAVQFRIQDLRIEMPGSPNVTGHLAGANIVNYGIKLGISCSSYNIIRCYINAGTGADK